MKKIFIPMFIAVTVILIGLLLWRPWYKKQKLEQTPSGNPSLAVLYFRNGTGDPSLDIWRENLCESLITDLSQSKYIRTITFDRIISILNKLNLQEARTYSFEDLKAIAVEGGVDYILQGSFSSTGQEFRINYTLQDIHKEENIGSDRIVGTSINDIFPMVDRLTVKVKEHLNLTPQQIAQDLDQEIGTITTQFPEAYDYYRRGRRYFFQREYDQAIPLLEKAISIDPNFAIAYRALATATKDNPGKHNEYATKAYELRENASEEERMVIEAYYYDTVENDREKNLGICEKILVDYPNNSYANSRLGTNSESLEDWDKVIKYCGTQVKNRQEYIPDYITLGNAYEAKGMYEKAREVYQTYIYDIAARADMHAYLAMTYVFEGRYDEALTEVDRAQLIDPEIFLVTKPEIYHLQGDFEAAEKGYLSWLEDERTEWKMEGRQHLGILYRTLGQYKKARNQLQAGLEYSQDNNQDEWKTSFIQLIAMHDLEAGRLAGTLKDDEFIWDIPEEEKSLTWKLNILSLKIEVYLEQNNIDKAMACVDEIKKITDETPLPTYIRIYDQNLGLIEKKRKNYSRAIDLSKQAYELLGGQRDWISIHARVLYQLASAYSESGALENAQNEYENILALTTGRLFYGNLYVKSYYGLGNIHEDLGNKSEAVEHYEKFLTLWKDADPGLSEIEDARKRLSLLK